VVRRQEGREGTGHSLCWVSVGKAKPDRVNSLGLAGVSNSSRLLGKGAVSVVWYLALG
jgi:hypothetical protein